MSFRKARCAVGAGPGRLPQERLIQRRRPIRRPEVGALRGVQKHRGIAHAAGQEPVDRHARPAFAVVRTVGQARAGGLHTEKTAVRGGNAHRSAAIRPVRGGHDSGGHRGARPAGRPARRAFKVPGVAGRAAIDRRLGRGTDSALGRGGSPEVDDTRRRDPFVDRGIAGIARVREKPRSVVRGIVDRLGAEVLQKERARPAAARRADPARSSVGPSPRPASRPR